MHKGYWNRHRSAATLPVLKLTYYLTHLPADWSVLDLEFRSDLREKQANLQNHQTFFIKGEEKNKKPSGIENSIEQDKPELLPELDDIFTGILTVGNKFLTIIARSHLCDHTVPKARKMKS